MDVGFLQFPDSIVLQVHSSSFSCLCFRSVCCSRHKKDILRISAADNICKTQKHNTCCELLLYISMNFFVCFLVFGVWHTSLHLERKHSRFSWNMVFNRSTNHNTVMKWLTDQTEVNLFIHLWQIFD